MLPAAPTIAGSFNDELLSDFQNLRRKRAAEARIKELEAERRELQNQLSRGELLDRADTERLICEWILESRRQFERIPAKIQPTFPAKCRAELTAELNAARSPKRSTAWPSSARNCLLAGRNPRRATPSSMSPRANPALPAPQQDKQRDAHPFPSRLRLLEAAAPHAGRGVGAGERPRGQRRSLFARAVPLRPRSARGV
jgi:hypothetical protein